MEPWNTAGFYSYLVAQAPGESTRLAGVLGSLDAINAQKTSIENKIQGYSLACSEVSAKHYAELDRLVDVLNATTHSGSSLYTSSYNILFHHVQDHQGQYPFWLAGTWTVSRAQTLLDNFYNEAQDGQLFTMSERLGPPGHLPGYVTGPDNTPSNQYYYDLNISGSMMPINTSSAYSGIPHYFLNPPFTLSAELWAAVMTEEERTYINTTLGYNLSVSAKDLRTKAWDIGLGYWAINTAFNGRIKEVNTAIAPGTDILIVEYTDLLDSSFNQYDPSGIGVHCVTYSSPAIAGAETFTEDYFKAMLNGKTIKIFDENDVNTSVSVTLHAADSFNIVGNQIRIRLSTTLSQYWRDYIGDDVVSPGDPIVQSRKTPFCMFNGTLPIYDYTHGWTSVFTWNAFYKNPEDGEWRFVISSDDLPDQTSHINLDGSNLYVNARSYFQIDDEYRDGRDLFYHQNITENLVNASLTLSNLLNYQGIYSGMIREISNPDFGLIENYASIVRAQEYMQKAPYAAQNEEYFKKTGAEKNSVGFETFNYLEMYTNLFRTSVSSLETQAPVGSFDNVPKNHGGLHVKLLTGYVDVVCPEKYGGTSLIEQDGDSQESSTDSGGDSGSSISESDSYEYAFFPDTNAAKYDGRQYCGIHQTNVYPYNNNFSKPPNVYYYSVSAAEYGDFTSSAKEFYVQNLRSKWEENAGGIGAGLTLGDTQFWQAKMYMGWWRNAVITPQPMPPVPTIENYAWPVDDGGNGGVFPSSAVEQVKQALDLGYTVIPSINLFSLYSWTDGYSAPNDFDQVGGPGPLTYQYITASADWIQKLIHDVSASGNLYGVIYENEPDLTWEKVYTGSDTQSSYATFSAFIQKAVSEELDARGVDINAINLGGNQYAGWLQVYRLADKVWDAYETQQYQPKHESFHQYSLVPSLFDRFKPHEEAWWVQTHRSDGSLRNFVTTCEVFCSEWAIDFTGVNATTPEPWVKDEQGGVYMIAMNTVFIANKVKNIFFRLVNMFDQRSEDFYNPLGRAYIMLSKALKYKVLPRIRKGYGSVEVMFTESDDGKTRYVLIANTNKQAKRDSNYPKEYITWRSNEDFDEIVYTGPFFEWLGGGNENVGLATFLDIADRGEDAIRNEIDWDNAPYPGVTVESAVDTIAAYKEYRKYVYNPSSVYVEIGKKYKFLEMETMSYYQQRKDNPYSDGDFAKFQTGFGVTVERDTAILIKLEILE